MPRSGPCARWSSTRPRRPAARILYAGMTGVGVFRSNDGGRNWTTILNAATPAVANELNTAAAGRSRRIRQGRRRAGAADLSAQSRRHPGALCHDGGTAAQRPPQRPTHLIRSVSSGAPDQGSTWTLQKPPTRVFAGIGMPLNTRVDTAFTWPSIPPRLATGSDDIIYFGAVASGAIDRCGLRPLRLDRAARRHPRMGVRAAAGSVLDRLLRQRRWDLQVHRAASTSRSLNGGGLQTGPVLQSRRQAGRDGERHPRRAAGQRHCHQCAGAAASRAGQMGLGGDGFDVAHDGQNATKAYGRSNANIFRSTNDGDSLSRDITPPFRLRKRASTWRPSRAIQAPRAACMRRATRTSGRARTAGRPGRTTFRFPGPPTKWTSRRPTATTWSSPSAGRFWCRRTRSARFTLSRHHAQSAGPIRRARGVRSQRPGDHLRRARRVQRLSRAGTCSAPRSPQRRGPTSLRRSTFRSTPSRSTGARRPPTIYAGTDFGVLRSVDGGANWCVLDDIHFPRAPVFELVVPPGRAAGRDVRPRRIFVRQADGPVDCRRS